MQKQVLPEAERYARDNVRRRLWRRFVRAMACIVVFCTTYALILPAITMEKGSICGLEEHEHSDQCYVQITSRVVSRLTCSYEALAVHNHADSCYGADGLLQCGRADYIVHEHGESCWETGVLVCTLPEVRLHEHTDACYELPKPQEHTHTEACEEKTLVCQLTVEPHTHTEDCYTRQECDLPEDETHTHTDACIGEVLSCQLTEQPHNHGAGCYETNYICGMGEEPEAAENTEPQEPVLICLKQEIRLHTHTERCYQNEADAGGDETKRTLICGQPEVLSHDHAENCFAPEVVSVDSENLTCQLPEGHTHSAEANCFNEAGELICELTQVQTHTHTERCYGIWELVCGLEVHTHTDECYPETVYYCNQEAHLHEGACFDAEGNLTCTQEEHTHGESCEVEYICGLTEHTHGESCIPAAEDHASAVGAATCGKDEMEGHIHSDENGCYDENGGLICQTEETPGHQHTDSCYANSTWGCGMEEHIHSEECVKDPVRETEPVEDEEPINMLSYTGDDYEVVLRFDASAGIPANAELMVTELSGEAYREHLERTYEAVGEEGGHTLIQFAGDGASGEMPSGDVTALSGSIGFARFFDLTILADGEEIEPEDTVEVTIRYDASVEIPEGDKTAVHFTHDGSVEVLNADDSGTAMTLQPMPGSVQTQEVRLEENEGETFVFLQDSFSVTGTITLGSDDMPYEQTTSVANWLCGKTTIKTLKVYADYPQSASEYKRIVIKVPSGFQIVSYSATEDTPEINGVTKVEIDNEYKSYIMKSDLKPASTHGQIVGVTNDGTWAGQSMKGYLGSQSKNESVVRTYGGDVEYTLNPNTQTVSVVVSLRINQELLSHTSSTEEMGPIVIEIYDDSADIPHTTTIRATATDIPVVSMGNATGSAGQLEYNASEDGGIPFRSDLLPVSASTANYLNSTAESGSKFESAEFYLNYPAGVFFEQGTAYCAAAGYRESSPLQAELIKNASNAVEMQYTQINDHVKILWIEDENGGGSITWYVTNATFHHSSSGASIGASYRANTNVNNDPNNTVTPCYKGGDVITGFRVGMRSYTRNGKTGPERVVNYTRKLIAAGNGKDIRLLPKNFTRRDITADFNTEEYIYGLGSFNVFSALPYQNNTFYFENPQGLKITALNLMGKNARDVTVVTNLGNTYEWNTYSETGSAHSGQYSGNLLQPDLAEGEYITSCLFTVDFEQITYDAAHQFGSFVYIGQFQDGDGDGSREGDVILRQLEDNTTYEAVQQAIAENKLDELTMNNAGDHAIYGGKPIIGTDHTTIGWKNTGVGAVTASVVNEENNTSEATYYANTQLVFTTTIESGYSFRHQDTLIDPTLVISLPEGLSLNTASVFATSAAGISQGKPVQLVQDGVATETVINDATWMTYRFKVPKDQKLALVAEERFLNTNTNPQQKITATFKVVVDPTCGQYDLSMHDVIMWDVRNTAGAADTLGTVAGTAQNGDATGSHWSQTCTRTDKNNFLGHGDKYGVANNGDTFVIKPLIGLNMDLAIKPVSGKDDAFTDDGYIIYNGLPGSIAPVIPDKYADVKLTYLSTSDNEYFKGTSIYVPIPKVGVDYSMFFENVNLTDPMNNEKPAYTKKFEFTMDLQGPVTLKSDQDTLWITYYAVGTAEANTTPNETPSGQTDNWEPVRQNGGDVTWLTADQITDWTKVVMLKFVAQDNVVPNESGVARMRLHVHDLDDADGPALGGTYNYWRGYGKAVTKADELRGNWKYTSVVAATPAMETLEGQFFIDKDRDGLFDVDSELYYKSGIYTAELWKDDGTMAVRKLELDGNGHFALVDSKGEPEYLTAGGYTVTIRRNQDPDFRFANTEYNDSIGKESPGDAWHNNVSSKDDIVATWHFTVTNEGTEGTVVHRVGIGLKAVIPVEIKGIKTFQGGTLGYGDFTFLLDPVTGTPDVQNSASNAADGTFSFGPIAFDKPGTYIYKITEDRTDPDPGIIYDIHTTTVTVTVTENTDDGVLSAKVVYDNSGAITDQDRAQNDRAAFTNSIGYKLPATGGAGTPRYTMGGLLLMAAAVILLYIHARKVRKEEWSPL